MMNWIELMGWGARAVLAVLFILSIWSVAIMIDRRKLFKQATAEEALQEAKQYMKDQNWDKLRFWAESQKNTLGGVVLAALSAAKNAESIDRAVQSYLSEERLRLERGLNVLATLGSNAPFIGLFGTVLGIIQSFGILSSANGGAMNAVMFGLAEALIATAVGLFVAIPAVVAYNYFSQKLRNLISQASVLRDLYVSQVSHGK